MEISLPSLNGGEISGLLAGRSDFKQRQYGGSTVENFIPLVQGPIIGRPGTVYVGNAYDSTKHTHLIGLNTASGSSYIIEACDYLFRFYTSGALLTGSNTAITASGGTAGLVTAILDNGLGAVAVGEVMAFGVASHGFSANDSVVFTIVAPSSITGIVSDTIYYVHTVVNANYFTVSATPGGSQLTYTASAGGGSITAKHNRITAAAHGLVENDAIVISGATGVTTINGTWCAKNVTTNTFELHALNGLIDFKSGTQSMGSYSALAGSPVVHFIGKMHPYSYAELFDASERFDVGYACIGDSVYFSHKDHHPVKLTVNSNYNWTLTRHRHGSYTHTNGVVTSYFQDGPWQSLVRDETIGYVLSENAGTTGAQRVGFYGSTTPLVASQLGILIREDSLKGGADPAWHLVTAHTATVFSSATWACSVYKMSIGGDAQPHTGYRFGLWHTSVGFPHRINFYQDRICYSMMSSYPTRIEMSASGNYTNFAPTNDQSSTQVDDSNAISFNVPGDGVGKIQWTYGSGKSMLVGTEGSIFSVTGTSTTILAPGSVQANQISSFGAENVMPIQAGGSIYYIEKGGTKMRAAGSAASDSFETKDITRVNPSIFDSGALGLVFSKTPYPLAWAWRTDGTAVSVTIDEQENVFAFARHVLGGSFSGGSAVVESMAVINSSTYHNEVWMVVKRTVNGSTVRHIEKLSQSIYADYTVTQNTAVCSDAAYVYNSTPATNVPSGALNHLIGESVDVVADGVIITGRTVNGSGQLSTALSTAASVIIVGLSFRPKFETTDLQQATDKGTTFGHVSRHNEVDVGFYRTLGAKIGWNSSNLNEISFGDYTTSAVSLFTGVKKPIMNGKFSETPRVRIEQLIPAPICITFLNVRGKSYG